jgi:hypothetical protein
MSEMSRYGKSRKITNNGHGMFTIEGEAHYYRVGMNDANTEISYFDPEGGPMIMVGDNLGFGVITEIFVETAEQDNFKIRVQTGEEANYDDDQHQS